MRSWGIHTDRNTNSKLALMQGLYWAANCVLFSFLVPLLNNWGYSDFQIGTLTMLMALSVTIVQPLWGMFVDKKGHIQGVFVSQMLVAAIVVFVLPFTSQNFVAVSLVVIILTVTVVSMASLIDAWSVKLKNEGMSIRYSLTRSFGSLLFAITAVGFGILLDAYGDWVRYPVFACLVVLLVLVSMTLRKPQSHTTQIQQEKIQGTEAFRLLLQNKKYVAFIISVFLMNAGGCVAIVFYPLLIHELGGNNTDLGLGLFIMAISEVPVLIMFGTLLKKVGKLSVLLATGMVFFSVKTALLALSPSVGWAIAFQIFEAFSFAIYLPAAIYYINEHVDRKSLVTAQMVLAAVYGGLGPIFGTFTAGYLSENYGVSHMMLWMSGVSLVGSLLFIYFEFIYFKKSFVTPTQES